MDPGKITRRFAAWGAGLLLCGPLPAQQQLYVLEPDGNYHPVVRMEQDRPFIAEQNRPVPAHGTRFALRPVEEYLPVFVMIHAQEASTSVWKPISAGAAIPVQLNKEFHFRARFESDLRLEDVFVVLAMSSTGRGRSLFAHEIGVLEAGVPRNLAVTVPLEEELGSGQYRLMVFAGGREVFTSGLADNEREVALDHMTARRIAGVQRAEPKPLFTPGPRYPDSLRTAGVKGTVMIAMRISAQGTVSEAVVEQSPHPACEEAALAVLPRWRFVPRVVEGRPVEARARLPMAFAPPDGMARP